MLDEKVLDQYLLAIATVTSFFLHSVERSKYSTAEVNELLTKLVDRLAVTEFWISDETGKIEYTTRPDIDFSFDVDADAHGGQAAAFTPLLRGEAKSVVQPFVARTHDGKVFKYVAVCGTDKERIVQVGLSLEDAESVTIPEE